MLTILYIGDNHPGSTSFHRARALSRLGHRVMVKNPAEAFQQLSSRWWAALHFRTGYRLLQADMLKWVKSMMNEITQPDLVWVDSGELMGCNCVKALQTLKCPVILYNIDDPTGKRDGRRFDSLLGAIPLYDLVVVVRMETAKECSFLGAKNVMRVLRSYDEVAHQPYADIHEIPADFKSDIAFIGTWMRNEKRDEFILHLIREGLQVNIWGDGWQKSHLFPKLKHCWRGKSLSGRDYIAAIQGAKICLGMLSKGNRDLHTTRSLEIPYAGGLLCAERTAEHQHLYLEGVEAAFWSDASECVKVCKDLLNNGKIDQLRLAGMQRVRALKVGNEDICRAILETALN
ncbi:CgeB family protein [Pedobacter sp. MR2016-24]|uniref:CgeB family protein n=1 Tax=Pedobacter sp. MR2016-24 TaxID=2994466 RepID=UPI0022458D72|nr:glycosyltransferase [Pedobacter sp. MR2016-24]MCX2485240.1 glycosyltransferase [Pedobacter sp. MR2016-24]